MQSCYELLAKLYLFLPYISSSTEVWKVLELWLRFRDVLSWCCDGTRGNLCAQNRLKATQSCPDYRETLNLVTKSSGACGDILSQYGPTRLWFGAHRSQSCSFKCRAQSEPPVRVNTYKLRSVWACYTDAIYFYLCLFPLYLRSIYFSQSASSVCLRYHISAKSNHSCAFLFLP